MVRRPKQTILQRIERGIEMQVPKHFTLNDVWEIMMEIAEVAPWAEDYIRQKGALFICYREDLAKKLALSGFLYKKRRRISIYQHWGEAAAA
ncbi:hypothetical protein KBC03_08185 [Patescibacteria group bacterium]|nr:hypothetical protein [Patescibacteria group bacterium]